MAQYVKATNFASKDALLSGDPNKIVKGAEVDDEFNNIQTAVNSKADTLSPTLTGTPLAPTATAGTNTTQIATTAFVNTAVTAERSTAATLTNKTLTSPTISGGSVTGITDLTVADGGTGASNAADARTNLGLVIGTNVAPVASPSFTGSPTAPTAIAGTNSTQVATTAFVKTAIDNYDTALTVSTSQIENDAVTTAKIAPTGVTAGSYGSSSAIPVVTVNAEGQVTSATTAAITIADPIGVNQTWQDVASSRALSTDYTNSTGRPIQVSASIYYSYDGTQAAAIVGGVTLCSMRVYSCCGVGVGTDYPLSFIVPAGATYRIQGGSIRQWAELR